jgi:hypothetical protein
MLELELETEPWHTENAGTEADEEDEDIGILDTRDWPPIDWTYTEREIGGGIFPDLTYLRSSLKVSPLTALQPR